ncbi:hypothetical protein BP5796_06191 [Coleophoma crateriformis]|uniref:Uncharacterized protein n=1 Tax=Coleophoma crateriformis TaxID=565419 RepID=A0A3D8RW85_9HELO|nr:hypothetical protein BP5796_06191 [Coleophoma crateriformis]
MANWPAQSQYPPRTSSRRVSPPGVYVNVEFGIAFSQHDRVHTTSMKYASKNMEHRFREQQARAAVPDMLRSGYPLSAREARAQPQLPQHPQSSRAPRLVIRRRDQERGTSAPPSLQERHVDNSTNSIDGTRVSSSQDRRDQPLPPLPSEFRLGEPDMPWSAPQFLPVATYEDPTTLDMDFQSESTRGEDPQRVRDLGQLQQAMMTVDSLEENELDALTSEGIGGLPRGPRSLGWAISTNDAPETPKSPAPPPYVVSQWEERYGGYFRPGRPRSSG